MRTTLDLADDVLLALKSAARREKRSIGALASDLVRKALAEAEPPRTLEVRESLARYGVHPLASRGGTVTNELIDQLRDGLD